MTPNISKPKTMSFEEAITRLKKGDYIARLAWSPANDFGLLKDGFLMIFKDHLFYKWNVNDGDLEGTDWVVVLPEN